MLYNIVMIKFASELKLKPVLLRKEMALVGVVENLIVDPETGKFAGLLVREGFGKKNLKTLPEKDLLSITSEFYLISGYQALGDIDEIVRLKEIIDKKVPIVGEKVYTVSGKYLGKCRDYTLDLDRFKIDKIYVSFWSLFSNFKEYAIAFSQIVSIEKERITVEDAVIEAAEPVEGRLADASN